MAGEISGLSPWRRSRIALAVPPPAPGADWSVTVPAGHLYRVLSVYATLVSSVAVATRVGRLAFGDGVRTFADYPPFVTQLASLTRRYVWAPGVSGVATGTGVESFVAEVTLAAGWTAASVTDAIDVADQWSGIVLNLVDTTVRDGNVDIDAIPDLVVEVLQAKA